MFLALINTYISIIEIIIHIDEKLIFHSINDQIFIHAFLLCKIIILLFLKLPNKVYHINLLCQKELLN